MQNTIYQDGNVTITPALSVIAGTSYQVSTINSIRVEKLPGGFHLGHLIMMIVGGLAALLSIGGFQSRDQGPAFVVLIIGVVLIFLGGARLVESPGTHSLSPLHPATGKPS